MKKGLIITGVSLLGLGAAYLTGVGYYSNRFVANTTFGTVDISNLTLVKAQEKLEADLNEREIVLTENEVEVARIKVSDLNGEYNTESNLESVYQSQDPIVWVTSYFEEEAFEDVLADQVAFNAENIKEVLAANGITNDNREAAVNATIDYSDEDGYFIESGVKGTEIDYDKLGASIVNTVEANENTIELEDVYAEPTIDEESEIVTSVMGTIEDFSDIQLTLQVAGNDITIPQSIIESWIYFDSNNELLVDYDLVYEYVNSLNDEYATYNKTRQFISTLQGEVTVQPGILGWGIDTEAETQAIIDDLYAGVDVTREPAVFSSGGNANSADEIGNTYIEIDLTYQMMYLYVDGELIVGTDIVSGQLGAETVPGANAVNEMLSNTNLVGYNQFKKVEYSVPVSYWIRFDNNAQGIHDASWQGSFGGSVWQYSGSLGCINTPYWAVETIYNNVSYGTPVLVFY